MRRSFVPLPPALALLALAVAGCSRRAALPDKPAFRVDGDTVVFDDASAQAATVRVAAVSRASDDHVDVTGRLVWDEDATARVFPPVAGRVARIARDFGSPVARGELLALLSSPDFGQAQSDAARSAADLRSAERTFERVSQVYERGGASRKDRDQAEADLERARAESERTRRRLELWGGEATATGRVDQDLPLRSPVAGVVVERNLNPGQEVRPDATTPLFVISDPHHLWVLLDVTERDLADVETGARLLVRSPAFPDRSFEGVLDTLGAGLDPATRTVRARGKVANPEDLLKGEMYVSAEIARKETARRLQVPARAVLQDHEQRFVFVEEGKGRYRRTPVQVGPEREGTVPVLSGLADGARIAVEGELLLEAAWAEVRTQ
jgi:cobalt-zinc-cadmium efflux system membrane fusion protein